MKFTVFRLIRFFKVHQKKNLIRKPHILFDNVMIFLLQVQVVFLLNEHRILSFSKIILRHDYFILQPQYSLNFGLVFLQV